MAGVNDGLIEFSSLDNILGLAKPQAQQPQEQPQQQPQEQGMMPMPGIGAPISGLPEYNAIANAPAYPQSPAAPYKPIPTKSGDLADTLRGAIRRVESATKDHPDGYYQAKNTTTSASGAYQYINGTWNNYGGYPEARLAPKQLQDAKANEDIARSLKVFNGDPFKVIANHMLPAQANKPWLWTQPSRLKGKGGKWVTIPPVIDYVRKVTKGTPYESQLNSYISQYVQR